MELEEDKYLKLNLVNCVETEDGIMFGFSELSTLQALRHFPKSMTIDVITIYVEDIENDELSYSEKDKFLLNIKTVGDFIAFFSSKLNLSINSFRCKLGDGIELGSHDDGEVSIAFNGNINYTSIIQDMLSFYNYDSKMILDVLLKNKSKYISIGQDGKKISVFNNFDEYLNNQ